MRTAWKGQTRTRTAVESYTLGGQEVHRAFTIDADEPLELLGGNTAPNPQELLMSALNACITVGYVAGAAMRGIALEKVEIVTSGSLDLRGFLGIDPAVAPGYDTIRYVVRINGRRHAGPVPGDPRDGGARPRPTTSTSRGRSRSTRGWWSSPHPEGMR